MRAGLALKSHRFAGSPPRQRPIHQLKVGDEAEQKALRRLFALVKKRPLADDMLIHGWANELGATWVCNGVSMPWDQLGTRRILA